MGHDVGMVTVVMAGAVSSSDFSSSILGTPGVSPDDRSFRIFLLGLEGRMSDKHQETPSVITALHYHTHQSVPI